MKILKVVLIILASVIGITGSIILGLYLTGGLNEPVIVPENIYFAYETEDKTFVEYEEDYYIDGATCVALSSKTNNTTQTNVTFSFSAKNAITKYLKKLEDNQLSSTDEAVYAKDAEGNTVVFKVVRSNYDYITDGNIILPKETNLNKNFYVFTALNKEDNFNVGGISTVFAQSENLELSKISKAFYVDVPVNKIEISVLNNTADKTEADKDLLNLSTIYYASANFFPARSAKLYGTEELKKVVYTLSSDERYVSLINEDGSEAGDISFVGRFKTEQATQESTNAKIYAYVFKDAKDYKANAALNANELYAKMNDSNTISKSIELSIKDVAVDGFSIDPNVANEGINLAVNNLTTITVNNSLHNPIKLKVFGANSELVQNEIQNVYLSIISASGDATGEYFKVYNTESILIGGVRYYKIHFNSNNPDNSYWEVSALSSELENVSIQLTYIVDGQIKTEEDSANLDQKYIPISVAPEIMPEVDWNEENALIPASELIGDDANKNLLLLDDNQKYIPVSYNLKNLVKITNIGDSPVYTQGKFFVYAQKSLDLTKIIKNCVEYTGTIEGINSEDFNIYELTNNETLEIFSLDENSVVNFSLIFAVIKHDAIGTPILDSNAHYQIVVVPETQTGKINNIPFEISKVANLNNFSFVAVEGAKTWGKTVQQKENNLRFTITLEPSDVEIFKTQVQLGNIYLKAQIKNGEDYVDFNGIYYSNNGKVDLKNALSDGLAIFDNINNRLIINLSTDQIEYSQTETAKDVRLVLVYKQTQTITQKLETSPLSIYSGKISSLTLNSNPSFNLGSIANIKVDKTVGGETTYTYLNPTGENQIISNLFDQHNRLNINIQGYRIDDTYSVESTDSTVIKVQFDGTGYLLNPVNAGSATVTIAPNYPANSNVITLNFTVYSNYTLQGSIAEEYNFQDDGTNSTLSFANVTNNEIEVVPDGGAAIYVNDFVYTCTVLNEDITNYIDFTYQNSYLTGFKIKKAFEMPAMVVLYYSNETYSIFGAVSIKIAPFYALSGYIDSQTGAQKPENSSAPAVFAETEVELKNLKLVDFEGNENAGKTLVLNGLTNLDTNGWINQKLKLNNSDTEIGTIKLIEGKWYVVFDPVDEIKEYDLTFTFAGNANNEYSFKQTLKVCVNPNIKLKDSFEQSLTKEGDVYLLNTEETAFKENEIIAWPTIPNQEEENTHYIEFERVYGLEEFANFMVEGEAKISYTISGITTLTKVNLTISYGEKEFKFAFWAEPAITYNSLSKVTYNGKEYISLYANQELTNSDGIILTSALINNNKVLDLASLYQSAVKNEFGLIITKVTIKKASAQIVRDCIIFPAEWEYITYSGSTETDVYKILSGSIVETIDSGATINGFASILDGKALGNGFNYEIFENNQKITTDLIKVKVENAQAVLETKYAGKTHKYKIRFKIFAPTEYVFDYYVQVNGTQKININYPTGTDATQHNIYYFEFTNNQYVLDLTKNEWNLQGKNYVELENGNSDEQLKFGITSITSNGSAAPSAASLNGGILTINNTQQLNIVINVSTDSESSEDYIISVQPNRDIYSDISFELKNNDQDWPNDPSVPFIFTEDYAWTQGTNKTINLSGIKLYEITASSQAESEEELHWVVISKDGHTLQTSSNKIYYENSKLVAQPSPNTETGILVAYSKSGIVRTFEISLKSVYSVSFSESSIQAGQNVDFANDITVYKEETPITPATIEWSLDGTNFKTGTYALAPTNENSQLTVYYKIYGGSAAGTSEDNPILTTKVFDITPNITITNKTQEVTANNNSGYSLTQLINQIALPGGAQASATYAYSYTILNGANGLTQEEITVLGGLSKLISQSGSTITISPKAVAAERTVLVNVTLTATSKSSPKAFNDVVFNATLTLKIKPDCSVSVSYPTFGTNSTFDRLYVWVGDAEDGILIPIESVVKNADLDDTKYIHIKSVKNTAIASDKIELYTNSNLIVTDGNTGLVTLTNGKIILTNEGKGISSNQTIVISVKVDGLERAKLYVELTKDPVFTATFDENGSNELTKQFAKDQAGSNNLVVLTKGTTAENKHFEITIVATPKTTGEIKSVTLYGQASTSTLSTNNSNKLTLYKTYSPDEGTKYADALTDTKISTIFDNVIDLDDLYNYTYSIADYSTYSEIIEDATISELIGISFFYNGNKMSMSAAANQFKISDNGSLYDLLSTTFKSRANAGTNVQTVTVVNKDAPNNTVATLTYTYVLDYSLTNYDVVNSDGTITDSKTGNVYDKNTNEDIVEFAGYGNNVSGIKVLKTVELTAGQNYKLIGDILTSAEIAIKDYEGLDFESGHTLEDIEKICLAYGRYTNNAGYTDNISGLISIEAAGKDANISPKGAENAGNIVHLIVRFGYDSLASNPYTDKDTYIIRIKINPSISITAAGGGYLTVKYTEDYISETGSYGLTLIDTNAAVELYNNEKVTNIPLSNIASFSGINASDLVVSVGEGANYVVGSGTNRLGYWTDGNTIYGIQLRKTIFGGNIIKLTISDKYGYKVSSTITYLNAAETSPEVVKAPSSIFEGESFKLAFQVGEDTYNVYKWSKESDQDNYQFNPIKENSSIKAYNSLELQNVENVIVLSNFNNLTSYLTTNKLLKSSNLFVSAKGGVGISNLSAQYNSSSVFNGATTLNPNFKLTLKVSNPALGSNAEEVLVLDFNTQLNQKYTIRAKNPYNTYDALYFGLARNYKVQEVFEVYDNESGMVIATNELTTFSLGAFTAGSPLTLSSNEFTTSSSITSLTNVANKVESESRSVTFNFNLQVNGMENAVTHSLNKAIYLTPTYFGLKYPTTYLSTYGQVLMGQENMTNKTYSKENWAKEIKLVDYYGIEMKTQGNDPEIITLINGSVSFAKASGEGSLSNGTLSGLSANSPITINVISNNTIIGQVLVTLARYYELTGDQQNVSFTAGNTLAFNEWTAGIKALIVGGTTSATIPSGISLFTFESENSGYEVIYSESEDEYKLHKNVGNFAAGDTIAVKVKYLGLYIGTINITINNNTSLTTSKEVPSNS